MRALSGMIPSSGGQVTFGGTRITALAPPDIVELGLVHVPEGRRLFAGMSVRDNLLMGAYARRDGKAALAAELAEVSRCFHDSRSARSRMPIPCRGANSKCVPSGED